MTPMPKKMALRKTPVNPQRQADRSSLRPIGAASRRPGMEIA